MPPWIEPRPRFSWAVTVAACQTSSRQSCVAERAAHCQFRAFTSRLPLTKFPSAPSDEQGLTIKMGQTNVQKYLAPLLKKIEAGEIDPSFVITHKIKLEDAPKAYKTFRDREDGCIKVVVKLSS